MSPQRKTFEFACVPKPQTFERWVGFQRPQGGTDVVESLGVLRIPQEPYPIVIAVICQPDGAETILDLDDSCYRAAATLLSVASVRNRT